MFKPNFYSKIFILFSILSGMISLFCFAGCASEPVETDLLLFVDFANIPENMALSGVPTDKIEIRIQADPKLIELINKDNIRYSVDLYADLEFDPAGAFESIEEGSYFIPVEKKQIPIHPAIKILSIKPSYLSVRLEKKISKFFKIIVPVTGEPAKGYVALEPLTEPFSVELTGAASLINSIGELKTKPIDISNAKEDFKAKIPLKLNNPAIVSSSGNIIVAMVQVKQKLVVKAIENIPIQAWNCSFRVNIEPSTITIKIKGPFETLSNKEITDQIYSFIDLKGRKPGTYTMQAYINIPVGLMMIDAVPQEFTIKII